MIILICILATAVLALGILDYEQALLIRRQQDRLREALNELGPVDLVIPEDWGDD